MLACVPGNDNQSDPQPPQTSRAPAPPALQPLLAYRPHMSVHPSSPPLTHAETRAIVLGVLLPVFMGSNDQVVLASALPTIGGEIGHLHDLPWLITVYLLAATAATPLYGKISDIHGRRFTLRIAIGLYLLGSLVCALAPGFWTLIVGRTLHGLGGGGLTSLGMVVLGDIAAPKDRGRYYAYFSMTYTTAGGFGPPVGGFLAQYVHWTAIFWLNIPLGLLALWLTFTMLRRLPRHERPHRLDVLGAGLIVLAAVPFMLLLNLGGGRYPWLSLPIVTLGVGAALAFVAFVWRLRTTPEPFIPLTMLANPITLCAMSANAFGWGAIIGLNVFLPIYLQRVMGFSATHAGLSLMLLMASVNISAGAAGQLFAHVRHYKIAPMIALVIAIGAIATLAWHAGNVTPLQFEILLALIGFGFGPVAPLSTISLQNAVPPYQFGTAIGTMTFARNLYATILVALFGALTAGGFSSADAAVPDAPSPALVAAFSRIFMVATASMALSFFCLLVLEEKPLQTNLPAPAPRPSPPQTEP
jgi:MFS family permease